MLHIVLLSGGSGTRLWPLSNEARSKQFLKLLPSQDGGRLSMVQRTHRAIVDSIKNANIVITAPIAQESMIRDQIAGDYHLVLEPARRDTAAAIMYSCAYLDLVDNAHGDDTVIVAPIDAFVESDYYVKFNDLSKAVKSNTADIVLLGTQPTYPSEKYGYIVPGDSIGEGAMSVLQFTEKPTRDDAIKLIDKRALWNCGVFAFKLGYIRKITDSYLRSSDFAKYSQEYDKLPSVSFDYEVVEKASSIAVVPYTGLWKDLGTWNTLTEEMKTLASGRVTGIATCTNTHIINELGIPLVALGLQNAIVVASHDGILVSDKFQSSFMKPFVQEIAESRPMHEKRSWGEYRVLDSSSYSEGQKVLTKELCIKSGAQLSYQKHFRRNETWIVVSGSGEAVLDGKTIKLDVGDVMTVAAGVKHSLRAFSDLHIIEVQIGDEIAEEDIERFGYYWK